MIVIPENLKNEGFEALISEINDVLELAKDKQKYQSWADARLDVILSIVSDHNDKWYDFISNYSRTFIGDILTLIVHDDYDVALECIPDFLEELGSQIVNMEKFEENTNE